MSISARIERVERQLCPADGPGCQSSVILYDAGDRTPLPEPPACSLCGGSPCVNVMEPPEGNEP